MAQTNPTSTREASPSTLNIIRLALIGGVVMIGGAFWFIMQQSGTPVLDGDVLPWARWGMLAIFAAAAVAIFAVRKKWKAADMFEEKRSFNIAGWAFAEGMAFVGAVYMFLTTDPAFFIVGFLAQLIVSFVVLPVPKPEK